MNDYNEDFWNALDELVNTSEIVIDRPKGSVHPRFPDFIYRVDYVILSYCCDWVSEFFFANGFTPRGELRDYPKGHTAYELEKRI